MRLTIIHTIIATIGLLACHVALADSPPLLQYLRADQEESKLAVVERKRVADERTHPFVRNVYIVSIDKAALQRDVVVFTTPTGETLTFTKTTAGTQEGVRYEGRQAVEKFTTFVWAGKSAKGGEAILSTSDGMINGSIRERGRRVLTIRGLSTNYQMLCEIDTTKLEFGDDTPKGSDNVSRPKQ